MTPSQETDDLFFKGFREFDCEKYELAIEYFDKILDIDPDNTSVMSLKAISFRCMQDYDRSIALLDDIIKLDPDYIGAFHNRGVAYYLKKDYSKSLEDFKTVIQLAPNNSNSAKEYIEKIHSISN